MLPALNRHLNSLPWPLASALCAPLFTLDLSAFHGLHENALLWPVAFPEHSAKVSTPHLCPPWLPSLENNKSFCSCFLHGTRKTWKLFCFCQFWEKVKPWKPDHACFVYWCKPRTCKSSWVKEELSEYLLNDQQWQSTLLTCRFQNLVVFIVALHSSTLAWKIYGWRSLVGYSPWCR